MPGMMDTILNLGLNDEAVAGLAKTTGNERFAYDSYRRLIQMYGEVVDGVEGHRFEQPLTDLKAARGAKQDVELTADDLGELIETFKRIYAAETGPSPGRGRSSRRLSAPSSTPGSRRARRSTGAPTRSRRPRHSGQRRPDGLRQQGRRSGTGVCFTRDPSTGESVLYGEFLQNAQGEDVVAGIRTPEPIERMNEPLPEAYAQLLETIKRLEEHYRDMQTSSSRSRRGRSTCSRRERQSGLRPRRCALRSRWWARA